MQVLDAQAVERAGVQDWRFQDDALHRGFVFEDFAAALAFVVRVGLLAEARQHHPEIRNVWSRVELRLNTHDAGGKVTELDLKLAREISALAARTAGWTAG